ncbi:LOW QUALITY PROTEIN: non-structural maintenance of chromosomes element 1 homolog [Procambarus clarkii]|uniref:LOW QUALITY PROTEIN: non-structural maintenance of chromosomes element 1 homolog n=1 Tax=Procambarus clarkii TaxID=6728 RepID=UPI0037439E71
MYSDAHRLFLQIITARRVLMGAEVKSTFEKCCQKFHVPPDNLHEFVMEINRRLEVMHLAIRKSIQEDLAEDIQCFVLVNTLNGETTRMGSTFNSQELALFKRIIEELVNSDDGELPETEAMNLATNLETRMKIGDSEEAIQRFIHDKWLLQHTRREKVVSLSALTISELQPYLEELYPELVQKCFLCKILTLKGYRCTKCSTRVHRGVGDRYFTRKNVQPVLCPDPECDEPWPHMEKCLKQKRLRSSE